MGIPDKEAAKIMGRVDEEEESMAIHGGIGGGYDVDCTHISNCCEADLTVGGNGTAQHYVCSGCGYPCDVKEKSE